LPIHSGIGADGASAPGAATTEHEVAAMRAASPTAGEYVESLGKTDLAAFSEDEWLTLIEVIVTAYSDALRDLADRNGQVEAPPW
jgi:Family of unknown function (DUF6511)